MSDASEYGTVISTFEDPTADEFSFVIKDDSVRKGQFVQMDSEDGKLIARVADIRKTNRYFMNPESVKNVESNKPMLESYPIWEWEYLVGKARIMGVFDGKTFQNSRFPPSPGETVKEPEEGILEKFFGFDSEGLHLGKLSQHDIQAKVNMTRLLQKHLAILALSGAGKSHLASSIIEEVVDRKPDKGQLAVVVIDTHGEYTSFAQDKKYSDKTVVFPTHELQIGVPNLSQYDIGRFTDLTSVQRREIKKVMSGLKGNYGMAELIQAIEDREEIHTKTKDVLTSVVDELRRTGIFGVSDYPPLNEMVQTGKVSVLDLSGTISQKKRQMLVSYMANKLFQARRNGIIPPFLLVLEEAHQYAPEKARKGRAISRGILQTIAREGRKFHASLCLISQRPVHLSTTILSQCNSQIILRVTNPYDLKHIGESSEGITKDVLDQISSLRVGSGLIVGEAVNFPLFVNFRARRSKESEKGKPLEDAALEYQEKVKQKKKDSKAFM